MSARARARILISVVALITTVFVPAVAVHAAPFRAKWTLMVYMSGDNNLEDFVVRDLETELSALGSTASVQITALADRGPGYDLSRGDWQTTKLFHPTAGMTADAAHAVADWGERDMGDPRTLVDFVRWSKTTYPADHYALYFWGHGFGWHPGWTMLDSSSADALDVSEVRAVLPQLGFIDVVGYDACYMAQIEILSLWSGHATAVTGSQEWVDMDGIEYDAVISQLAWDPDMTPDEVALTTSASTINEKTWSAVPVDARFDALRSAVDAWSVALRGDLPVQRGPLTRAFSKARSFWQAPTDLDLSDLARQVNAQVADPTLRARGTAVIDAVDRLVMHRRSLGKQYDMVRGITITGFTRPWDRDAAWTTYRDLDFARSTGWDEFLDVFAS
jgi:Clostripain family